MSILDDAIRQHLELKRAHGADDSELKKLEDEAFGPPQRPDEIDPFAEAPTEFLVSPAETPAAAPEIGDETARAGRRPDIADLQEAPPAPSEELAPGDDDWGPVTEAAPREDVPAPPSPAPQQEELVPPPDAPPPTPADAAVEAPPPPADELRPPPEADELPEPTSAPAAEGSPADQPDVAPAPADDPPAAEREIAPDVGPDTEERHAIADQPTQMFDVQAHVDAEATEATGAGETPAGPEQEPLDTRGPDAEVAGSPPAEAAPAEEESAEYDFFNEQRLSDELDQALEAPLPPTDEHIAMPRYGDAPPAQSGIFDFESDERHEEDPSEEVPRRHDAPEPPSEPSEESPRATAEPPSEESSFDYDPDTGHEDVLEDTPRFLEDAPEDDDLWFEQKPPKDFDL